MPDRPRSRSHPRPARTAVTALAVLTVLTGCAGGGPGDPGGADGDGAAIAEAQGVPSEATAAEDDDDRGASVEVLVDGLRGPTQIAPHPDGRLLVAEIGDGEGTPTGTVSAIDPDDPRRREVLLSGLTTPTGVAVAGGRLWVMEPERLLVAPLGGGAPTVVFDEMVNNGRSNGTLTTLADGSIVFDTAGRRRGFDAAPGSGTLWRLDPALVGADGRVSGLAPDSYGQPVLTGMKHAYAVAELADGRLAVTEMSDGRYDGDPAPDEVHVIDPADEGLTGGWPRCIGDRVPVTEFDGTAALCDTAIPSLAVLDAGATPTGLAVAPEGDRLLVTAWTQGVVLGLPIDPAATPVEPTVVVDGLQTPQHLLVVDGEVLLTLHQDGTVVRLIPG